MRGDPAQDSLPGRSRQLPFRRVGPPSRRVHICKQPCAIAGPNERFTNRKVILTKELKGKGGEGDVVDVAQGFAVNYLIPNRLAIAATKGELKQLEQRRHNIAKRELARTTDANTLKEALDGKAIKVLAKVGEEGQLFGSVTSAKVAEAIADQIGCTIDRKQIELGKAIKMVGEHKVTISIYRDIKAVLTVNVVDEAAAIEIVEEPAAEEVVEAPEEIAAEEETEEVDE